MKVTSKVTNRAIRLFLPEMKECFINMDNAIIHAPEIIGPIIMKRRYTPVYLPTYSSELNPIVQFWSIIKVKIRRTNLTDVEALTTRIIEASEAVLIVHLENIIQHSVYLFEEC
jgi:transposase